MMRSIIDHFTGKTARKRAAMEVMDAYFKARAAYDQAKRRGDTREHDASMILELLKPLEPSDHPARLVEFMCMTAALLVNVCGERRAYELSQRVADSIVGVAK